ncbi:hypothetical protein LWI28_028927 [Acer negundo]|uniref:Uncharacterized protein n=1 Tax=Acer negundo TaxID=4023 RepID=A0AAD5I8J1_ACENE|nr:hypothetical protein LWI28_028927 [Acer negundo]
MLKVEVLKAEKYALVKKFEDLSKKNHKLKKLNKALAIENEASVQELEDLAKLTEEFEEETSRKMRKTLMSIDAKNKEIEKVKEGMIKKEVALKIAKVKECDYLVEMDQMEQTIKSLAKEGFYKPQGTSSKMAQKIGCRQWRHSIKLKAKFRHFKERQSGDHLPDDVAILIFDYRHFVKWRHYGDSKEKHTPDSFATLQSGNTIAIVKRNTHMIASPI